MSRRIVWIVTCCLMTLALILMSCGPAATEEEEEEEGGGVGTEEPQYGGTLTRGYTMDINAFDELYGFHAFPITTIHLTNEELWTGDWSRGIAGTGEVAWDIGGNDVWEFKAGAIAESWDFSEPGKFVWQIREGIHWGYNPDTEASRLVNGRELTADDVVFTLTLLRDDERSYLSRQPGLPTAEIYATDKYTVVIEIDPNYGPAALMRFADFASIVPPEVMNKYDGMREWDKSVGTGPFILTEYVPGTSITLSRNENYWRKDPVGPGKGNQLPYLDSVRYLIITDTSTMDAAFRTAQIDQANATWETFPLFMDQTDGVLKYSKSTFDGGFNTHFDIKNPPFNDTKIRQAMMMAIDWESLVDGLFGGEAEINTWPVTYNSAYAAMFLPINEASASVKELYTYNLDKAKKLLDEAGHSDGFKVSVGCTSTQADYMSVLADMYSKINVELQIEVLESGVHTSLYQGKQWYGDYQMFWSSMAGLSTALQLTNIWGTGWANATDIEDSYIGEMYEELQSTLVNGGQNAAMAKHKELMEYVLEKAWAIPYPKAPAYRMWWPWLKNYYGEFSLGNWNEGNWATYVWLDQELKKSMGE
ncbi:ABC transporter substrate-binding protein [Chloroflexota bacterium]